MKRAVSLVVLLLAAAGAFLFWQHRASDPSRRVSVDSTSASNRPPAPALPATAAIVPPPVPSKEELTKDVAAIEEQLRKTIFSGFRQTEPKQSVEQINRVFDALEHARQLIPRDRFDPAAIVSEVGKDPVALAEWVKRHTQLVAYRGSLRGAVGVLMDRRGNSLDRALLLHDLLVAAGREARLARADPTGSTLDGVEAASYKPPQSQTPNLPNAPLFADFVKLVGANADDVETQADALKGARRELRDRVRARAKAQAGALLAAAKPYRQAPTVDERAWRREALADHWFVQYRDGVAWLGLDPLAGRDSLEPIADLRSTATKATLPPELLHQVRVHVVAEAWHDGALKPMTVLDMKIAPSATLGQAIMVRNIPAEWPEQELTASNPRGAYLETARKQGKWRPVIVVGNSPLAGQWVTADGRLVGDSGEVPAAQVGSTVQRGIGKATDLFSALPTGESASAASTPASDASVAQSGVLTAQWIEFETIVPGSVPEKARRYLFDVVGESARAAGRIERPQLTEHQQLERALAMLSEIEIMPAGHNLAKEYVAALRISRLLALRSFLVKAAAGDFETTPPADAQRVPGPLFDIALARHGWSESSAQTYFDRPNLLAYWQQPRPGASVTLRQSIDIIFNYVAVADINPERAFQIRLEQGVLDTNVESVLFLECSKCGSRGSAAEFYRTQKESESAWLLLAPGSLAPATLNLPVAERGYMNRASTSGHIVAMNARASANDDLSAVWWVIDQRTGRSLGMGAGGMGTETVEYSMIAKGAVVACTSFYIFGMVRDVYELAGRPLSQSSADIDDRVNRRTRADVLCLFGALGIAFGGATAGLGGLLVSAAINSFTNLDW